MGLRKGGAAVAVGALFVLAAASGSGQASGRPYELVSPPDKQGNAIDVRSTVQSAPSGDAVAYGAPGAFGGSQASIAGTYYVGRRTTNGWSVDPIDPPQDNRSALTGTVTRFLSRDLDSALQVSQVGLLPGANDGGSNIYRRDNASGVRSLALAASSRTLTVELTDLFARSPAGATPDLSHFVFMSADQLLPDAAPGTTNVYELAGNALRLASRLPDGSVDPAGAQLTNRLDAKGIRPISADGRRVFFNAPAGAFAGPLYMRLDGATTVPISVSRRVGDPATAQPATFISASENGTVVYFASGAQLTDDATFNGAGNGSLYRLDMTSGDLTNLTVIRDPADFPPEVIRVLGVARDGSSVYFLARNALTPDSVVGASQIYFADGDGVRRVAQLDPGEVGGQNSHAASDNLRYFAFASFGQPTGFDNADPGCKPIEGIGNPPGICNEVYVYDAVRDQLRCASCRNRDGGNDESGLGQQNTTVSDHVTRAVQDDGRVFFNSNEALVPGDVNGRRDVYQWQDGATTLISTGRSPEDSTFAESSADGRDVFFFTYDRLVAIDRDDVIDLYDARLGGGIQAQNQLSDETSCDGDGCQGALGAVPALVPPGSSGFTADGNAASHVPNGRARPRAPGVKVQKSTILGSGAIRLRIATLGRGRITVSGRRVTTAKKSVPTRATYSMTIRLTPAAKRSLKREGKLKVPLRVAFTPARGKPSTATVSVTLRD
jgi:hypothetical protein